MSHRYRVAFRETLCGRNKGYSHNGFSREAQSSVRETMISGACGYENSHLVSVLSKYFCWLALVTTNFVFCLSSLNYVGTKWMSGHLNKFPIPVENLT